MIFYFSGTGNTRWAAEYLAEHTNDKLLFIPDEINGECKYTLAEGENIGFCFPIHGWQPPKIVREFIKKLSFDNAEGHYTYAVCTCGDTVGKAMSILDRDLAKHNLKADLEFSLQMPNTYVCLPGMDVDTKRSVDGKYYWNGVMAKGIALKVNTKLRIIRELTKGPLPILFTYVIGAFFNKFMITDKPFTVSDEKCIKCGKCAEVCPVNNIIGGNGSKPEWKHDGSCTNCLACYHICPNHAINYGKRTRKRGQYTIDLKELNNTTK